MATWKKCTDDNGGRAIWINLDNVTNLMWHDLPRPRTEIIFVGGGQIFARERPEDLTSPQSN
jgi:hypothetical protein